MFWCFLGGFRHNMQRPFELKIVFLLSRTYHTRITSVNLVRAYKLLMSLQGVDVTYWLSLIHGSTTLSSARTHTSPQKDLRPRHKSIRRDKSDSAKTIFVRMLFGKLKNYLEKRGQNESRKIDPSRSEFSSLVACVFRHVATCLTY